MNKKFWVKKIIGFIVFAIVLLALLAYVVMLLWNNVVTGIFSVVAISYWQSLGLLVLCKILFGGIKGGWGRHRGAHWKKEMAEKWHNMTPEERDKIKEEWRNRCHVWGKSEKDPMAGAE